LYYRKVAIKNTVQYSQSIASYGSGYRNQKIFLKIVLINWLSSTNANIIYNNKYQMNNI